MGIEKINFEIEMVRATTETEVFLQGRGDMYNEKEALSVADTSIIFEDEKKFVYKILDNNKIEKTEVKTGIRKDGNLEILEGLSTNDKIVKEGLSRLADGMLVKPTVR